MKLLYEDDGCKKISYSSMKFLMEQLSSLVTFYEKNIYIDSKDTRDSINTLKEIISCFNQGRYSDLINDVNLIEFDTDIEYFPYDNDDLPI